MNFKDRISDAFHGKTVLVTGHTGFKGGWLALWLHAIGAKIVGYSLNPPTNPSFFQETGLKNLITDKRGDILEKEKLTRVVEKYRPDFIFHLAAQPLVRDSYKNPWDTFNVNVMGTVNILEAIRLSRHPTSCVCITSDKCYENREWIYAYRENDALGGYDPYSASKGAAEIAIASYRKSFFNPEGKARLARSLPHGQAILLAAETGQQTALFPIAYDPWKKTIRLKSATRMPFVHGSLYWIPCPVTSSLHLR